MPGRSIRKRGGEVQNLPDSCSTFSPMLSMHLGLNLYLKLLITSLKFELRGRRGTNEDCLLAAETPFRSFCRFVNRRSISCSILISIMDKLSLELKQHIFEYLDISSLITLADTSRSLRKRNHRSAVSGKILSSQIRFIDRSIAAVDFSGRITDQYTTSEIRRRQFRFSLLNRNR